MFGGIPEGKSSVASQTDLAADEIDNLVSEVEECRRQYKILTEKLESKKQGCNMVYPGPIDPYFLAVILIPEPHFPQNFDP